VIYPDDANGDVFRRKEAAGDDLTCPRDLDFTVVFPDQDSAEKFAVYFRLLGYAVSVEFTETVTALPWDVVVAKHMALSYEAVVEFEDLLESVAIKFGGRNDGWGCFSASSSTTSDRNV
jgi:hypothetical protein